jgi:superfamily II DNA/RNA helicase
MTGLGVTHPFPIQAATLPDALAGRDVLGRARTGSGKTLAFGLALLTRTAGRRADSKRPLALVLVSTRELAQQVSDALAPYARALDVRLATVVGGLSINRQAELLRGGAEVVVATPGRLADLVSRRDCHLDRVRITVLDEADQMCDMGFLPQVTGILDQVPGDGQRLLFSATLDGDVDGLVRSHLHDPVLVSVDPASGSVATMEHHVLTVHPADKYALATEIAARDGRVLMFLDTKAGVDRFLRQLRAAGVRAAALHSGKSQPQRTHTLGQFVDGDVTVLVATNVAARGIHVDALDLVVNVDPPADAKDYLHRGGRTARAGQSGRVEPDDVGGGKPPDGHPGALRRTETDRHHRREAPSDRTAVQRRQRPLPRPRHPAGTPRQGVAQDLRGPQGRRGQGRGPGTQGPLTATRHRPPPAHHVGAGFGVSGGLPTLPGRREL